jgi:hypothetical protein
MRFMHMKQIDNAYLQMYFYALEGIHENYLGLARSVDTGSNGTYPYSDKNGFDQDCIAEPDPERENQGYQELFWQDRP